MSEHVIRPRIPVGYCRTCGKQGVERTTPQGRVYVECPDEHEQWALRTASTRAEELGLEIAGLPRAVIREVFDRIEDAVPDRAKPVARSAAKAVDGSIWDLMLSSNRVTVPR